MPHLSPMLWSLIFIASWLIMLLAFQFLHFYKTTNLMMLNYQSKLTLYKWKWFQDGWMMAMNCKFTYGQWPLGASSMNQYIYLPNKKL